MEVLRLAVSSGSPALARAFVTGLLELWGYDADIIRDVRLMISELATNAVLHVGEPFVVELDEVDQGVRGAVWDPSPTLPVLRDPDAAGGRGLRIVRTLATEWGALAMDDGGKSVWFVASPGRPS